MYCVESPSNHSENHFVANDGETLRRFPVRNNYSLCGGEIEPIYFVDMLQIDASICFAPLELQTK